MPMSAFERPSSPACASGALAATGTGSTFRPFSCAATFSGSGLRAFLLRRAEHAGDLVAAREERLEDGFAEVLLTDDCDAHVISTIECSSCSRVGTLAFFGGSAENAPALFSRRDLARRRSRAPPSGPRRCARPAAGERSIFAGEADSLIGMPTLNHLPRCGWSSSTHMSRPRTCSSLARSSVRHDRAAGHVERVQDRHELALGVLLGELVEQRPHQRSGSCGARRWWRTRGSVARSGMPTSGPMRLASASHTASCTTT